MTLLDIVILKPTLNERLSNWVCGFSWERIPPEVIEDIKLRILDIVGVMLGGRSSDLVSSARKAYTGYAGGSDATIVGFPGKTSLSAAAFVNGVLSSILEFDDSHVQTGIHSTGPVVSAVLPVAQHRGVSGRELIEAVLLGSELTCRLGQVAPGLFHKNGFHPTAVFGIFGAVYALARLQKLSPEVLVNATGIAGSLAAGGMASWEDGTSAKSLHVGMAASGALQAVELAKCGVSGPRPVFDGRFGFFRSHVQAQGYAFDFDAATRGLGQDWEVLNVAPKAYPCGYVIQPFIDGALELRSAHRLDPEAIAEITCLIAEFAVALVCEPVAEKLRPVNSWHARVSLQHSVAEALVRGELDKRAYAEASLRDARINALAGKVKYAIDPRAADRSILTGEIVIRLKDGRELRHRVPHMRGTRANPMLREDFVAKFTRNAADVVSARLFARILKGILDLEHAENAAPLLRSLSSRSIEVRRESARPRPR